MIDAFTPLGVGSEYSWMRSGCCAGHFRVIENADKSGFMLAPKSGISVYRNGMSAGHVSVSSSRHCEEAEGRRSNPVPPLDCFAATRLAMTRDRKSTRLNSSH